MAVSSSSASFRKDIPYVDSVGIMYILYGVNTQPRKGNERMPKAVFDIGEKIGFLTVVGVVSAGTLAAATAMDPSVPRP
jgi:hypothetical protein